MASTYAPLTAQMTGASLLPVATQPSGPSTDVLSELPSAGVAIDPLSASNPDVGSALVIDGDSPRASAPAPRMHATHASAHGHEIVPADTLTDVVESEPEASKSTSMSQRIGALSRSMERVATGASSFARKLSGAAATPPAVSTPAQPELWEDILLGGDEDVTKNRSAKMAEVRRFVLFGYLRSVVLPLDCRTVNAFIGCEGRLRIGRSFRNGDAS
jgi:hypothetical protein